MKIDLKPQNPLEWLALQTGLIPRPVLLAHLGFIMSKILGEAVSSGILEAMAPKPLSAAEIAGRCHLHEKAVTALLDALAGMQLVVYASGKYKLAATARKWLLPDSRQSYAAQLLFDNQVCYQWMNGTSDFLRTGRGLQYHDQLSAPEWTFYQDAMFATSGHISRLAMNRIRVPATATRLLDIGGAHGLYSNRLLQKHSQLSAWVLDLPEAVAANAGRKNPFPDRLHFTAGNILQDPLQPESYDIVLMANVAHHFTAADNLQVAAKVWQALKPGGSFYILEFFRQETTAAATDMIGALQSFFFSFSSTSGLWTAGEISRWLQETGYRNTRTLHFAQLPGLGMIMGKKVKF